MKTINRFIQSNREIDENGYLTVYNCLLLHGGTMEYSGEELINGTNSVYIDNVQIEPNKIYKLNISSEELKKSLDSFKLVPIVNGHTFLGKDGENSKDYQEGSVGENLEIIKEIDEDGIEKEFLVGTLKFTNPETIELINEGKKEELSTSYSNDLKKSTNSDYDFEVINIVANHIALVEKGRAGSKVRVANKKINKVINKNEVKMSKDTKKVITKNEEDKDVFNDVSLMEAAKVLEEETEFHREHPVSESSEQEEINNEEENKEDIEENKTNNEEEKEDKEEETKNVCKNKIINEINELLETIKNKTEELLMTNNNDSIIFNSVDNVDRNKIYNEIKTQLTNENKNLIKAYNEVKTVVGDFDFSDMNEGDIYKKAFENLEMTLSGKETTEELKAMFKVYNQMKSNEDYKYLKNNNVSIKVPKFYI